MWYQNWLLLLSRNEFLFWGVGTFAKFLFHSPLNTFCLTMNFVSCYHHGGHQPNIVCFYLSRNGYQHRCHCLYRARGHVISWCCCFFCVFVVFCPHVRANMSDWSFVTFLVYTTCILMGMKHVCISINCLHISHYFSHETCQRHWYNKSYGHLRSLYIGIEWQYNSCCATLLKPEGLVASCGKHDNEYNLPHKQLAHNSHKWFRKCLAQIMSPNNLTYNLSFML